MKKILCPTDFSDTAHSAIAYAAKLAQVTHCDLTLLHVQSLFDLTPAEMVMGKATSIPHAEDMLNRQCKEVTMAFKINCYAAVEPTTSKLSNVIREKAHFYDLVVMGTDGADDLYQFFGGSNTYNAVAKSKVPALMVPSGYEFRDISHMTYAYDYFRTGGISLMSALPVLKALRCELRILQVMEESVSNESEQYLEDLQTIIQNTYKDDLRIDFHTIHAANVGGAINTYTLKHEPDALALSSVERGLIGSLFHKSVIKKISDVCSYPVFVFP